jgi:alcohol oxidase
MVNAKSLRIVTWLHPLLRDGKHPNCWHSLGTVKMKSLEESGGVGGKLDVHGVTGLKAVDLSIVPRNVAANTCNTALMVGEKGAGIILERELGLIGKQ